MLKKLLTTLTLLYMTATASSVPLPGCARLGGCHRLMFAAELQYDCTTKPPRETLRTHCSATMIKDGFALTALHCFYNYGLIPALGGGCTQPTVSRIEVGENGDVSRRGPAMLVEGTEDIVDPSVQIPFAIADGVTLIKVTPNGRHINAEVADSLIYAPDILQSVSDRIGLHTNSLFSQMGETNPSFTIIKAPLADGKRKSLIILNEGSGKTPDVSVYASEWDQCGKHPDVAQEKIYSLHTRHGANAALGVESGETVPWGNHAILGGGPTWALLKRAALHGDSGSGLVFSAHEGEKLHHYLWCIIQGGGEDKPASSHCRMIDPDLHRAINHAIDKLNPSAESKLGK